MDIMYRAHICAKDAKSVMVLLISKRLREQLSAPAEQQIKSVPHTSASPIPANQPLHFLSGA